MSTLSVRSGSGYGVGDSSSVADVAFLLLIFFIVTSSFLLPQGFFLKLPSNLSKPIVVKKKYIIDVYPQNDGTYLIDKKTYDVKKFQELLVKKRQAIPETILVVNMKKTVLYSHFTDTLNLARLAKLNRISLKNVE